MQIASAADSIDIRDCKFLAAATNLASASDSSCKFSLLLRHRLMQMNPNTQVLLPHKGAPSFSGSASCPSPSPSWLCMMIKITKGDRFFSLWRYLYCILVPGGPFTNDVSGEGGRGVDRFLTKGGGGCVISILRILTRGGGGPKSKI